MNIGTHLMFRRQKNVKMHRVIESKIMFMRKKVEVIQEVIMILQGKVTSGIGTAKMWVGKIEKVFKEKTGMKVFHGTLNIKLENDYMIDPDWIIRPAEFGGTENVLVKKCKIMNEATYMVRAEKNQKGQGDHNLKIIEIVSDINFREKYNLKDNENILIEII